MKLTRRDLFKRLGGGVALAVLGIAPVIRLTAWPPVRGDMHSANSIRAQYRRLVSDRAVFEAHWRELAEHTLDDATIRLQAHEPELRRALRFPA
ncbi:hypothetical protein LCGC14_1092480 [marine sediment metagenome]|uniref:Uncharacterized protein n=1 Tax=marine sediment metagenome TaxID=412755 RepID=A0A0F9MZQ9_9ZZZZ